MKLDGQVRVLRCRAGCRHTTEERRRGLFRCVRMCGGRRRTSAFVMNRVVFHPLLLLSHTLSCWDVINVLRCLLMLFFLIGWVVGACDAPLSPILSSPPPRFQLPVDVAAA
jgi:hypothetical protein